MPNDKVRHHAAGMMLQNVAVVHPSAWPVTGDPGDSHSTIHRDIDGVFPGLERWWLSIAIHDLEEEPVRVKWVVHFRQVDQVPYHGATISNYVRQRRVEHARTEIGKGNRPLSAIALEAGFADQSHFTRVFRQSFGETPGQYARSLRGRMHSPV
jgi:hypothetical protein